MSGKEASDRLAEQNGEQGHMIRSNMLRAASLLLLVSFALPGLAETPATDEALAAALGKQVEAVKQLAASNLVVEATRAQNKEGLSLATIKQRDEEWKAAAELTDFKRSLQTSDIGKFFKNKVDWSSGVYNEIFLTDDHGANVAAYPATSDYWQGDEEKWTAAFNGGSGKVFVGPMERDESTGVHALQISAPVLDGGKTIGVLIVGVKLSFVVQQLEDDGR